MSTLVKRRWGVGAFEPVIAVARQIKGLDPSECPSSFEIEFEALMACFYDRLLDLDAKLDGEDRVPHAVSERFKELIETGRQFDELWDAYHREKLDPVSFSKRLGCIRG